MAKIYSAPASVGPCPEWDSRVSYDAFEKQEQEWVKCIVEYCRKKGHPLSGERLYFPAGDGYAQYVVLSEKPLQLIHLPIGDAWSFPYAHRLTLTDVREEVGRRTRRHKLFAGNP